MPAFVPGVTQFELEIFATIKNGAIPLSIIETIGKVGTNRQR